MKYSFNRDREGVIFAHMKDINASYKDLCAVCDSIRYKPVPDAVSSLESTMQGSAVLYRRHNTRMGSRHELGGRKGRYPMKCASIVRKVLLNAMANSRNKGFEPDVMFVVHASANKTNIVGMPPSKGILYRGAGYGYVTSRRSDLEFAKVEIGIAKGTEKGLSDAMKSRMKAAQRRSEASRPSKAERQKPQKRQQKSPTTKKQDRPATQKAEAQAPQVKQEGK